MCGEAARLRRMSGTPDFIIAWEWDKASKRHSASHSATSLLRSTRPHGPHNLLSAALAATTRSSLDGLSITSSAYSHSAPPTTSTTPTKSLTRSNSSVYYPVEPISSQQLHNQCIPTLTWSVPYQSSTSGLNIALKRSCSASLLLFCHVLKVVLKCL